MKSVTGENVRPSMSKYATEQSAGSTTFEWDEVNYLRDYRRVGPSAAIRRVLGCNQFMKNIWFSHTVILLPFHLQGEDPVILRGETEENMRDALNAPPRSQLLGYFDAVQAYPDILRFCLFKDVVKCHMWNTKTGVWDPVKRQVRVFNKATGRWEMRGHRSAIGRLYEVKPTPANMERYVLKDSFHQSMLFNKT